MQNNILELIQESKRRCLSGAGLDRAAMVRLFDIDPVSDESMMLREAAYAASMHITEGKAFMWGAIGIDNKPCPMNCTFCSLGEKWGLIKEEIEYSDEEIISQVNSYANSGVHYIVLRTTEYYSPNELKKKLKKIREQVPGDYKLILNTGEFGYETACQIYDSGAYGIYHALRLREGIDTSFDPKIRMQTLAAIQRSPLELIHLVEPVGPEHTSEELADTFITAVNYGVKLSGVMARIPVKGTPFGDSKIISDARIAQLTAVYRLAGSMKVKNICVHPASIEAMKSGANVVVIETGVIPRDSDPFSITEWHHFTADDAKGLLERAGYHIESDTDKSKSYYRLVHL